MSLSLDSWDPQTCPFRIHVTRLRITDSDGGVHPVDIDPRNGRGQKLLGQLLIAALFNNPGILKVYDGLLDGRSPVHPDDCPLCALHRRPGPRMWGRWIVDSWHGHPRYGDYIKGKKTPVHRADTIELFGDLDHAREVMTDLGEIRLNSSPQLCQISNLHAFTDRQPSWRSRMVFPSSQLWLWHDRPRTWWPDIVLEYDSTDWSVTETTGAALRRRHDAGQIPFGRSDAPVSSGPPDTITLDDLIVRCVPNGAGLCISSIHDTASTAPARRILPDGQVEPLPGAVAGLTVYGRWLTERPRLGRIGDLTPEYAALVPAIRERLTAVGR